MAIHTIANYVSASPIEKSIELRNKWVLSNSILAV